MSNNFKLRLDFVIGGRGIESSRVSYSNALERTRYEKVKIKPNYIDRARKGYLAENKICKTNWNKV